MDFIEYSEIITGLTQLGVVEVADGNELIRLEVDPTPKIRTVHVADPESKTPPYPDATVIKKPKAELPEVLEEIIGRIHLAEVLVIPVCNWRAIIDCVAFDLAGDEAWQEVDAIAAVHQNKRNALAITRGETTVLIDMVRAIFNNGSDATQDLVITSDVSMILVEVFFDGAISVTGESRFLSELSILDSAESGR